VKFEKNKIKVGLDILNSENIAGKYIF